MECKELEQVINRKYKNLEGLVAMQSGEVIYEKYFQKSSKESTFHIFSATKSIVAILIGIAIDKGYIEGVHQKILDFFPEYQVKGADDTICKVTLEDMLTMTVPYRYRRGPYKKFFTSEDWVKFGLDMIGGKGRIGDFFYAGLIGPDIFTGILQRATKQSVLEFARENLFQPLGIEVGAPVYWESKKEQMEWYHTPNPTGWVVDPQGVNTGGWGLSLRAADMAKLGQLMLAKGVYQGKRIVSAAWIEACTKAHSAWRVNRKLTLQYGYLWWLSGEEDHSFAAMGDGGNVIYVNPAKDRVIAIASSFQPRAKDRMQLIQQYLNPTFDELNTQE